MESCYVKNITAFIFFQKAVKKGEFELNHYHLSDLKIGDTASLSKQFSNADVMGYAAVSGDSNPVHVDEAYAKTTLFKTRIVHGMLVGGLFSSIFGMIMPGIGTIYTHQSLKFTKPVFIDDTITAVVTVKELIVEKNRVIFDCVAKNQNDEVVIVGEAQLMPPR
jgi:3-hydroxybutyryl-CoA dehydratase